MYNSYFRFRESPFSVTPDPKFFYTNPAYQEAFATLRYGIEGKKGLIVITGEVGTGKTTLLRRLMRSLEATTHSVFIFYTDVSFAELLRLILRDLGLATRRENRSTMIKKLNDYLIEQLKKGHIVSLLIDEAQNLSDEAIEGIRSLSNLDTDKKKLLQIVLIGQPELETKLDQPGLLHLKQRVALRCRLASLNDNEVGPYIDSRLQAAGYEGKGLFPPDAVKRIAFYSRGTPRLINIICDNALLIAYADSKKSVAAEVIEQVALDLRLKEESQVKMKAPAPQLSETKGREEVSQAAEDGAVVDKLWESGFEALQARIGRRPMQPGHRGLAGAGTGIFLAVVLFVGAAIALHSQQSTTSLLDLSVNLEDIFGIREQPSLQARHSSEVRKEEAPAKGSHVQGPPPQDHASSLKDENRDVSPLPEAEKPTESEAPVPAVERSTPRSASKPSNGIKNARKNRAPIEAFTDPETARKRLQLQIYKAIHNRAITGVEVSVKDGTAYLDGRVATETQKFSAEQAARTVPGVTYVRNRIVANSLLAPRAEEGVAQPGS